MADVQLSNKAEEDIEAITQYIASDSTASAGRFLDDLAELFRVLSAFPDVGASYAIDGKQYALFPVSHRFREYLTLYTNDDSGSVFIVRVVHGKRDIPALFA